MRGFFITCEGCEGVGKSSFVHNLEKALSARGVRIVRTREPGGTPLGEKIRNLVLYDREIGTISFRAELLLFLAARAEHVEKVIAPAKSQGAWVLCDRYIDSSVAYQAYGRNDAPDEVEKLCRLAVPLLPDYTFVLDLNYEEAKRRRERRQGSYIDTFEMEEKTFHDRVRQGFLSLAHKHSHRSSILDASLSEGELVQKALTILEEKFFGGHQ